MSSPRTPSRLEAITQDDVTNGILRLPLPAQERIDLLKSLHASTDGIDANGNCIIEGPLRETLDRLFTQRYGEVRAQRQRCEKVRLKIARGSRDKAAEPMDPHEEEELARIVQETRGDFDLLHQKLIAFERSLRNQVEEDVRKTADQLGIEAARKILNTDGGGIADGGPQPRFDQHDRSN